MTSSWLSQGYRPFFLGAGLWAALAIVFWLQLLIGAGEGYSVMSPIVWHRHEMIFGYAGAALAGFLLTAIPNWTGRAPICGAPLLTLFGLWVAGRIGNLSSSMIGAIPAASIDGAFWMLLVGVVVRELIAGGNHRNLPIALLVMLAGIAASLDHMGFSFSWRLGIATVAMLILLVGGRVTPSFTRNWLAKQGHSSRPPDFDAFDKIATLIAGVALVGWVAAPENIIAQLLLVLAGLAGLGRLSRWRGHLTLTEPLVLILHVGYAWTAIGIALIGLEALFDLQVSGVHALSAGGVAVMTMAVMTRASLGHSGRALQAGPAIVTMYCLVNLGAVLRVTAPLWPFDYTLVVIAAAATWASGFVVFVVKFLPIWLRPT